MRKAVGENGFAAFIADGSILPRESGVSERPMKNAVLFKSPESMRVTFELPHKGKITGMGIKKVLRLLSEEVITASQRFFRHLKKRISAYSG